MQGVQCTGTTPDVSRNFGKLEFCQAQWPYIDKVIKH